MGRFIKDVKQYWNYSIYAARAELKSEVSNSHLNWLWWILDPVLFMLVYSFVVNIIFSSQEQYLQVFIFIGLTLWNFFSKVLTSGVDLVVKSKSIITRIYVPKFVFLLSKMFVHAFKMGISLILVFVFMIILQVPFSFTILNIIPIFIVFFTLCFGFSIILMHLGVFIGDFKNIVTVLLKLTFYLSGVFYSLSERIGGIEGQLLLKLNPIAFLIAQSRDALLYNTNLDYALLGIWFAVGLGLSVLGINLIYKYENTYVKVI